MNIIEIPLKRALVFISLLLMLLCLVLPGCTSELSDTRQSEGTNKDNQTTNNSYLIKDSKGHFHTNDVNLAQREIPFTIVVPSYIPECFGNDYFYEITGPYINEFENTTDVKIRYAKDDYDIYISEISRRITMMPNEELEPIYYDISGTRVLRQITQFITGTGNIFGLGYYWNPDGLTFEVETFNISEEEGLKIVESMINNKDGITGIIDV